MADYTGYDVNNLLPGEPWTSAKALASFEDPVAIAEGASGAPVMEVARHLIETVQPVAHGNIEFALATPGDYSDLWISIAGQEVGSDVTFNVQINIAATWRTVLSWTTSETGANSAAILEAHLQNMDNADGTGVIRAWGAFAEIGGGFDRSDYEDSADASPRLGYMARTGDITGIRVTGGWVGTAANSRAIAALYGRKTTQP